ncbi:MAG: hypothetical protein EBR71_11580 [Planctomycetes bacterium]|nr:hypothetical protein [Planctomycetota bacterium]
MRRSTPDIARSPEPPAWAVSPHCRPSEISSAGNSPAPDQVVQGRPREQLHDFGFATGAPRQQIQELASLALTLVADPSITPGGCVIESAGTVVDATVQKRWLRAIGTLGLTMPWDTPDESA